MKQPLSATPVWAIAALTFYSLNWSPAWIIAATVYGLCVLVNILNAQPTENKSN